MSDQNSEEQGVKATVILSAATALMGAVLGVVSLAGESGLWPSFSRERVHTEQAAAHGAVTADDTLNDYRFGMPEATSGDTLKSEVAWNSPREECSAQPRKQLATVGRRGEARTTMRASVIKDRAAQDKSLARASKTSGSVIETSTRVAEVASKGVDKSIKGGVDEGGGTTLSKHLKVVAVRVLPKIANQIRAAVSASELPVVESARLGFGSPHKCLRGSAPPGVDKSVGPAAHVAYEMIERREPSLYLVPLLSVLDETAAAETPKAEESDASEGVVPRSVCTGGAAGASGAVESPGGESDTNADSIPHAASSDAATRQED